MVWWLRPQPAALKVSGWTPGACMFGRARAARPDDIWRVRAGGLVTERVAAIGAAWDRPPADALAHLRTAGGAKGEKAKPGKTPT